MGKQLIFVVETTKQCKSDWIYIKETIDYFYSYDRSNTKITPIYMGGKDKYKNKQSEIKRYILQYSSQSKNNESHVIYFFDCDEYDHVAADETFLINAKKFCVQNGYDFVWFCKDVERVYLNKKVENNQKGKIAEKFMATNAINRVDKNCLEVTNYRNNSSNILIVMDKYLTRK